MENFLQSKINIKSCLLIKLIFISISRLFRIKLSDSEREEQWELIIEHGGKTLDIRVVAHTMIFHKQTNSLILYGVFQRPRLPLRNNTGVAGGKALPLLGGGALPVLG